MTGVLEWAVEHIPYTYMCSQISWRCGGAQVSPFLKTSRWCQSCRFMNHTLDSKTLAKHCLCDRNVLSLCCPVCHPWVLKCSGCYWRTASLIVFIFKTLNFTWTSGYGAGLQITWLTLWFSFSTFLLYYQALDGFCSQIMTIVTTLVKDCCI